MAKKVAQDVQEVKTSKKDIINKVIKTIEVAIAPAVVTAAGVWGFDIAVYVAAVTSAIIAVLRCIEVFIKD